MSIGDVFCYYPDLNCEEPGGLFKIKASAGAVSVPSENWAAAHKGA